MTLFSANARPVFAGKITVGERLFNAIFYLFGGLFQFHGTKFVERFLHAASHKFLDMPLDYFFIQLYKDFLAS